MKLHVCPVFWHRTIYGVKESPVKVGVGTVENSPTLGNIVITFGILFVVAQKLRYTCGNLMYVCLYKNTIATPRLIIIFSRLTTCGFHVFRETVKLARF